MVISHIFLDMDDVLCDFQTAAARLHGVTDQTKLYRQEWEMEYVLGLRGSRLQRRKAFWSKLVIHEERFWLDLPAFDYSHALITILDSWEQKLGAQWNIVSTPYTCKFSQIGKIKWLENLKPGLSSKLIMMQNKQLLAAKDRILIDDRLQTVQNFATKGIGILFPSYAGPLNIYRHDPLANLGVIRKAKPWKRETITRMSINDLMDLL